MMLMMTHPGPGLWMVSQVLLLIYFKMDNGSNVCGIEFDYNNEEKEEEKKEEEEEKKEENAEVRMDRGGDKELVEDKEEMEESEKEEDDSKSILSGNESKHEVFYNDQIFRQLFLGFKVKSEEGRSVNHCQEQVFCSFCLRLYQAG